ncbi:RagB/SusD family nutrient uptake outer membrane protein [Pedobacter sp. SD-b]|uniref:RagB/SusD family nutrient uptake outer membrane protein n=1 Tax=Pedobacter segetis TaxID=2793069 RepID=A0ABS1BLT9_9SPHI|nr:RagB/SusD family nutrient uptake outer membrane protein [Pedobacter segetis]MBK0383706.1 RagB/SusD family nutrient uptake outer membrane protein [Pedobacter segetis]
MMNKKNKIYSAVSLFLTLGFLSACVNKLDVVPSDKIGIDRIINKNTIRGFRNNIYDNLDKDFTTNYNGQLIETYTDDAFRAGTGTPFDWHNGLLSLAQNFFAGDLWNQYWMGVRKANLALEYLPQSTAPKDLITDKNLAQWIDEAKVVRVWYHFELIKNFGAVPFIDKAYSSDFNGWAQLKRPTYDEISTRLVSELDEVIAAGNLLLRNQTNSDYDKINLAVAYALKSKILLYNASLLNNPTGDKSKWKRAADAAKEAIAAIVPEYSLLPLSQYGELFNQTVSVLNKEVIFRSSVNGEDVMNNQNGVDLKGIGSATQSSNAGAVPTQELVDCFELLDGSFPVASYNNADHTSVTLNPGYSEAPGANPYAGRDARLAYDVVFNGTKYGKYKGIPGGAAELKVFTYNGKSFTGFNNSPTSQEDADRRRSATGYYSRKYRTAAYWGSTAGGTDANKIYFRLAEVYLNLAEANCEVEDFDGAIAALDIIRLRAGQPAISTVPGFTKTKDFLMKRIRNERRVELCFEGQRFYDQRRWKIIDKTNDAVTGMKITSSNGSDNGIFSYQRVKIDVPRNATTAKYLILPLPIEEARRLPGIGQPNAWR